MSKFIDSLLTLGKVALKSRGAGKSRRREKGGRIIIMGNGPSLRDNLLNDSEKLEANDTMAVNFAANTDDFFRLKPNHYILADPHFFTSTDANVEKLWSNLGKADWPMTLHIPVGRKIPAVKALPEGIALQRFNMTPGEGSASVCHPLYRRGLAMPRPRNVMIPAVMEAIRDGYEEIYLIGADHTWPHTLYVDDRNRVVTVQPHFYEENPRELDRIAEAYKGVHIHNVLESMMIAFRSYHMVRQFADREGVKIFNATPGSLIDAFTRKSLP